MLVIFLTNDFGLIDIEKTAIITAIAVDTDGEEYTVTAQIAVPEATDTNTENQKAVVSASASTIGYAIKKIGNLSGWFPKLSFCNLVIIGKEIGEQNAINVLDYFAKTLRVQDSAVVVLAENKAQELLEKASPLDNISSFALQKILLKNTGLDNNVSAVDVRTFCKDYYSETQSSHLPLVKIIEQQEVSKDSAKGVASQSGQDNTDGANTKGNSLFDATTTALFYRGVKVGELTEMETLAFIMLDKNVAETTFEVPITENGTECVYLVTVINGSSKKSLSFENGYVNYNAEINLYCKISDQNRQTIDGSTLNKKLPETVTETAEEIITGKIYSIVEKSKECSCDILAVKEMLYRFHHDKYELYKDTALNNLVANIKINVYGQK